VDDGSTDGGDEIAAGFPDPRFRLVRQPNGGPGSARNRGIEECQAELVAFLDADDEWLPDYLITNVSALDRLGPDVASSTSSYFMGPGAAVSTESMWRERGISEGVFRAQPATDPVQFHHTVSFMLPCSTVARLAVVRRWGGFYAVNKCRFAEDAFLWTKVLLNETVHFSMEPRVRVYTAAGGLSHNVGGARPIEPFLQFPEEMEKDCPPVLLPLLQRFLTIRAFKTSCVFGYWGDWRRARTLRRRFHVAHDRRLPYYWRSMLISTPFGAAAGALWRAVSRSEDPPLRRV
jgi:hypothetical protein